MKPALIILGILLGAFLTVSIVTATPLVGEVVTLHTRGEDGEWKTTPLWVVDTPTGVYLRSGAGETGWVARSRANPEVRLERAGAVQDVRLIEDASMRAEVNERMARKYGWADSFVALMRNTGASLPLRVEAVSAGS